MIYAIGMHMLRAARFGIHALRGMQVDGPAAKGNGIRELLLADNIVLGEHIVTREAAVLPFARQRTNPLQRHMICIKLAGVLDMACIMV